MNNNQRALLLIILAAALVSHLYAQALQPRVNGALLRVAAPQLRFLSGRILERLHSGAAVPFQFRLAATSGGRTLEQANARFVLSYDLWEERYSIQQTDAGKRAASHLTQDAAEVWCLENLELPVSALAGEKTFVLKLEIRAEEAKEDPADAKPSFSMAGLIDVFSRKPREEPLRWSAISGLVRLQDLVPQKTDHKSVVPKP